MQNKEAKNLIKTLDDGEGGIRIVMRTIRSEFRARKSFMPN